MSERYSAFFYGTLLHPSILRRVIGHPGAELDICPALLLEHTRHQIRHADYPALLPYTRSRELFVGKEPTPEERTVRGTLVKGLTQNDVDLLDVFEGDEYARQPVTVYPLSPFIPLSPSSSPTDPLIVPSAPPPLPPLPTLTATTTPIRTDTYIWIMPVSELRPELWSFADFVRENAWKWVGKGGRQDEEYVEVDKRKEMNGVIVRREVVGGESGQREVVVELEVNPCKA